MSRRFFIRLALAMLAMALVCVAAYAGLGWAVWSRSPWVFRVLDEERFSRLFDAYAKAADWALSGDRDGDGFSDGWEMFCRYKPDAASHHPNIEFQLAPRFGILTTGRTGPDEVAEGTIYLQNGRRGEKAEVLIVRVNESLRVRGRLRGVEKSWRFLESHHTLSFASGFQVRITGAAERSMVARVDPEGFVSFDISLAAETVRNWRDSKTILIDNAATGEVIGHLLVHAVRAEPAVELSVRESPRNDEFIREGITARYYLDTPEPPSPGTGILIEAAVAGGRTGWSPVRILTRKSQSVSIDQDRNGGARLLEFRAIPVR